MTNGTGQMRGFGSVIGLFLATFFTVPSTAQDSNISWGYNTYGIPGMVDMPVALGRADAELGFIVSSFANQNRITLTFQISERLSASFRYSLLYDVRPQPEAPIADYRFDRSFSFHYRLLDEGKIRPAVALGINDLLGTGIYAGEYLVLSKTLRPDVRVTAGLGWGRLGSHGSFTNPLSVISDSFINRPDLRFADAGQGGQFQYQSWFHGDAAVFGGIEWQATDRLRLVAEYSSDDQAREDGAAFNYRSPFNFGLAYQYSDRTTLTANYLHGSTVGLQLTYAINPISPRYGSGLDSAPPSVLPVAEGQDWLDLTQSHDLQTLRAALAHEGVSLDGLRVSGNTLQVQIRNDRYAVAVQTVGRTARVLSRLAPAEIVAFDVRLTAQGVPVTSVTILRQDLEALEFDAGPPDLLQNRVRITDVTASLPIADDRFPIFSYGLEPYLLPSLFDPDSPLRADLGVAVNARFEPRPGLIFTGLLQQKLAGNIGDATRESDSVLPRVRSESSLYYRNRSTFVPELTAAFYFRPGEHLYGRVTAGYLESMFGGISAELLWKRQNSRLAFGAEVNYVRQRTFDELFGFQDYAVATGHLSAYYELGSGLQGQLDIGRYLAGDLGATLTLAREFDNGWRIGAFATITNVSAEDFGEGSFDKGILLTVPLDWVTGQPQRTRFSTVIRPILRDGGARLSVSGRLYDTVRENQATELDAAWGRFWR
jgi:hypothetical protein